ncbi:MAG TPA: hypothetical protein VGP07_01175 [Polyangia bacterium]|jgi:hypothetical protein
MLGACSNTSGGSTTGSSGGNSGQGGSGGNSGQGGSGSGSGGASQTGTGGGSGGGPGPSGGSPGAGGQGGSGGSGRGGTSGATGGSSQSGGAPGSGGAGGSGAAGSGGGGGATGSGGSGSGGSGSGGNGSGGSAGAGSGGAGGAAGAAGTTTLVACPTLPNATASPLYSVTVNGSPLFVEQLTKFSPEMEVHYAHGSLAGSGTATVAVTVKQSFSAFTLSPKSRNLGATKSGNTITFNTGPNYLILQVDSLDLLFILLDTAETNPPKLGDANVKSIADYTVDSTGATLMTSKIQSAINAASTATQNILYFPPGKYLTGELWMKSNVTMYLACGAELYGSSNTADFNTGSGGINIEGAQHALVRMYQIQNAKILGRGTLDSNGHYIRGQNLDANLLKIEQSSSILVDGITSVDSSYWNTLVYRSDQVTVQNYKVVNCRPSAVGGYNQTDGVDFVESTNGLLSDAFLYTGDDGMAPKNEDATGVINTKNLTHQHVVVYNNSVGCKIGTNSVGQSMDGITFDDIDIVRAGRAMTIEAYDTAVVSNATFSNIRVEAADSMLINLALDVPPTWRTAANTGTYKDTYFTNVSSNVKQVISLHGKSSTVNIAGVHFKNLTVQGKAVTSQTDTDASWDINQFVSGITFQ